MRIPCEDPVRRRLAETAARRAAAGQDSAPVLAGLRRLNLQLLLAPAPPPRRRPEAHPAAPAGLYRVSRFAFCILLLGVGAFFEHLFLPEWLCIVS